MMLMLMLTMMLMLTKKARDNQHLLCKNCSKQGQGRVANNWKRYFWSNSQRTSQKHKKYVWINFQWTHSKCKTHWRWRQPTIPFNGDDCFENHRKIAIVRSDLKFVKKFTRPNFRAKEFYTLKFNKMCKFFKSYEESLYLGACKPVKYVRNYVVFWKNLHSWQKFYTTAGRGGRDKFQVWVR